MAFQPRLALRLLGCLLICAMAPIWTSHGHAFSSVKGIQGERYYFTFKPVTRPVTIAPVAPAAENTVYLPLISNEELSTTPLQFGSGVNNNGTLVNPGTTFQYGISELWFFTFVRFGSNTPWKVEVTLPDGQQIVDNGTLNQDQEPFYFRIFYPDQTPLARGNYQFRFFLADRLQQQGTVIIQ